MRNSYSRRDAALSLAHTVANITTATPNMAVLFPVQWTRSGNRDVNQFLKVLPRIMPDKVMSAEIVSLILQGPKPVDTETFYFAVYCGGGFAVIVSLSMVFGLLYRCVRRKRTGRTPDAEFARPPATPTESSSIHPEPSFELKERARTIPARRYRDVATSPPPRRLTVVPSSARPLRDVAHQSSRRRARQPEATTVQSSHRRPRKPDLDSTPEIPRRGRNPAPARRRGALVF